MFSLVRKGDNMKLLIIVLAICAGLLIAGCAVRNNMASKGFKQISQEEAKTKMTEGSIIVDVRTKEEYDEGHIPGAICIPNETINNTAPSELPDMDAVILVYCRSGRRSKEASQKLAEIGYTNIYEFGGINSWTGDVVK